MLQIGHYSADSGINTIKKTISWTFSTMSIQPNSAIILLSFSKSEISLIVLKFKKMKTASRAI